MIKKWTYKNLEYITIGYVAISVVLNLIFFFSNSESISNLYFNVLVIGNIIFAVVVGYLLIYNRYQKKIDTKGYSFMFLLFSLLTSGATFINFTFFFTISGKYNYDFTYPISSYVIPIILLIIVLLSYREDIIMNFVSKRSNFNLLIVLMYVSNKILHVPSNLIAKVSEEKSSTIIYYSELIKESIDLDGYFVIFGSIVVFLIPVVVMFVFNSKYSNILTNSKRDDVLTILTIVVVSTIVVSYGSYFYLGIMTGYRRSAIEVIEVIQRIEYIYIVVFYLALSTKNQYKS